jgi:predicted metal-dependent phosphoesterase TrpH
MKFELHCHSTHSHGRKIKWEGMASPTRIAKVLHKLGFGGFALTDHDSIAGLSEASRAAKRLGMVFIPAMEVSTLSGHLIALGISERIKYGLTLDESIDLAHDQGGITVAPHPLDIRGEGVRKEFFKADAVEVFNSLNLTRVENALAAAKVRRMRMPAVGGSDAHNAAMLGLTANVMQAHDMDSALSQIKKGMVKVEGRYAPIPMIVDWARQRMKLSYPDILQYISKHYSAPKADLSRLLLRMFVNSESRVWYALGYFSVGVSTVYSMIRLAVS